MKKASFDIFSTCIYVQLRLEKEHDLRARSKLMATDSIGNTALQTALPNGNICRVLFYFVQCFHCHEIEVYNRKREMRNG